MAVRQQTSLYQAKPIRSMRETSGRYKILFVEMSGELGLAHPSAP
jgi:hypothetical protein